MQISASDPRLTETEMVEVRKVIGMESLTNRFPARWRDPAICLVAICRRIDPSFQLKNLHWIGPPRWMFAAWEADCDFGRHLDSEWQSRSIAAAFTAFRDEMLRHCCVCNVNVKHMPKVVRPAGPFCRNCEQNVTCTFAFAPLVSRSP